MPIQHVTDYFLSHSLPLLENSYITIRLILVRDRQTNQQTTIRHITHLADVITQAVTSLRSHGKDLVRYIIHILLFTTSSTNTSASSLFMQILIQLFSTSKLYWSISQLDRITEILFSFSELAEHAQKYRPPHIFKKLSDRGLPGFVTYFHTDK